MTTLASLVQHQRGRPGRQADEASGWVVAHQDIGEAAATQGVVDDILLFTSAGHDGIAISLISDAEVSVPWPPGGVSASRPLVGSA